MSGLGFLYLRTTRMLSFSLKVNQTWTRSARARLLLFLRLDPTLVDHFLPLLLGDCGTPRLRSSSTFSDRLRPLLFTETFQLFLEDAGPDAQVL